MLICPLCKKKVSRFKSNSHVIPEWMYKKGEMYDEKGRMLKFSNLKTSEPKKNFIQKGYRGAFICEDCKEETGKLDSYASLIFKDINSCSIIRKEQKFKDKIQSNDPIKRCWLWSNFDFKKIQNFIYSIYLRQHFFNLSKNEKGIIIDNHLNQLLKLYRSDSVDDKSYPIYIFYYDKTESDFYKSIVPPYKHKMSGHYVLRFGAGGFEFIVKTSSHSGLFSNEISLKSFGSIYIAEILPENSGMLKQVRFKLQENFLKKGYKFNP